ncbi:MAG: GNAT family N-acetyltransferase [Ignavibacteria bacterium]|nr:GNAT family N-acetyltransferase [Ignavibacteria bacterium]
MSFKVRALRPSETMLFIKSQWAFYKDDPHWVPPLLMDRKKLLNTKVNPFFRHAEIQLFVAEQNNRIVGRIAAITNAMHNATHHDRVGFFGFFESIHDQGVATALFTAAEQWLRDKGMDTIRGPVNPSMNDECGLLVHGFDGPPVVLMSYNPPYYVNLIEDAGFGKAKDLYAYRVTQETYRSDKLKRIFDALIERKKITFRSIDFKDKHQYRRDVELIKHMYNTAWQPNWGFVKMTDEEFDFLANDLKQIADSSLVFFAEIMGVPAGFILALPDINQVLIRNRKGRILKGALLLLTQSKKIDFLRILVLGVLPEFQKSGVDAAMYSEIGTRGLKRGIVGAEASWILEDNEMMNRGLTTTMNGDRYRTYRIYEKRI